jgi:anti-anti-sigma factor
VEVSTVSHAHAIVVAIKGRLDSATAPQFETEVLDLIAKGHRRIIVDLAELGYISSAGLRVLIVAAKRLKPQGGRLLLAGPGGMVSQVLGISGFAELLETCASTEEALARAAT